MTKSVQKVISLNVILLYYLHVIIVTVHKKIFLFVHLNILRNKKLTTVTKRNKREI